MKTILTNILLLISLFSFGQELTTIRVSVPNKTDDVYIVGNGESLGNWKPDKIKLNRINDYEREISLNINFPADFKFTRGSWETEGYTSNFWEVNSNLQISKNTSNIYSYKILSWKDKKQESGNFIYDFKIINHFSSVFNENRTIGIKLPNNYNPLKKYSVVYVLDANTLLKPFVLNIELLSEKIISQGGTDFGRDNIPEVIIIGVFHNNRNYETEPKFDYETDNNLYLEGSEKLKNYLFNELVPMVNSKFLTTNYNSIVGHSNTGHFVLNLPFFKNNPFEGIMGLSINAESEYFKNMIYNYLKTEKESVFIGYGTIDNGFNELGEFLDFKIKNDEINNLNLKVQSFEASHNQLPALSASAGIKFLFRKYKNFTSFINESLKPNFSVTNYIESYKKENEKYGLNIGINGGDLFALAEIAMKQNNIELFRQVIEYSNQQNDKIQNHLIFWLSTEFNDYETADRIIEILLKTKDEEDIYTTIANFQTYSNYLSNIKKTPKSLLRLTSYMFEITKDYKLEFAYHFSKIAYEYNIEIKEAKKFLQFCRKNYKENRVFKKEDLDKIEIKK